MKVAIITHSFDLEYFQILYLGTLLFYQLWGFFPFADSVNGSSKEETFQAAERPKAFQLSKKTLLHKMESFQATKNIAYLSV